MPTANPLISIITLNYNQAVVTLDFLESAKKLHYTNFEILVCDMASAENVSEIIHPEKYPNTRLLLSNENLGFAAGNNWGMRKAKGEYYFIVNNDTVKIQRIGMVGRFGIVKIVTIFRKPNNLILYFCYPKIQISTHPPIPFLWYFGIFCLDAFSHSTDCLFCTNRLKPTNTARFMKRK